MKQDEIEVPTVGEINNFQITHLLRDIPEYLGDFDNHTIPEFDKSIPQAAIFNITPAKPYIQHPNGQYGPNGSHWVALYYSPSDKAVDYFDSYGVPPSEEIVKLMKTLGQARYSNDTIQPKFSIACGYYCVAFIKERSKGTLASDFLNYFAVPAELQNDEIAYSIATS